MIVDVRNYTLILRKLAVYLEFFEKHALPVMSKHGLDLIGYHTSVIGPLNQVVHIWQYESLADIERKRSARDADPSWGEFLARTEGMAMMQDDKVLRPIIFCPRPQTW